MDLAGGDDAILRDLYSFLADWKNITLSEFEKIKTSDWRSLEHLQSKKALLQKSIEELEGAFVTSQTISEEKKITERKRLKQIAAELLALEKKNETMLAELISEADKQLKHSNKTIQGLRHVQQAYGSGKRSFWQAYS